MSEIVAQKTQITLNKNGLNLTTMDELWRFAGAVIDSGIAPKGMEKQATVFIVVEMGLELGLPPMASVQNIASVNGRPSIWGDAQLALVRASGLLKEIDSKEVGSWGKDDYGWMVSVQRVGDPHPISETYTVDDAKRAGLWGKQGPWTTNPKRMLKYRARAFVLRDVFPDVLKGMLSREEVMDADFEVVNTEPAKPKLFGKPKKTPEAQVAEVSEVVDETPKPAETPVVGKAATQEKPKEDAPAEDGDGFEEPEQTPKQKLLHALDAEGLTSKQLLSYAKKNGLLANGKLDEFAVNKMLNAWDTVKAFIGKEQA